MDVRVTIDFEAISKAVNLALPILLICSFLLGRYYSFYFHFFTVTLLILNLLNFYYLFIQKEHALLGNFGIVAQGRYLIESIGPELRQYLYSSDVEEKPFNRVERTEVYRKAKGIDSSSAFGSQSDFDLEEIKLRHSMFPVSKDEIDPYSLEFVGDKENYVLKRPIIISAMSYGALGKNAVRALARGAKKSGILMNTGEGGFPKYHLMEGCDLIFQMGTAKFGVRDHDGYLDERKLEEMASLKEVKIVEIKFSQGAKPGKGGLLPKEKITKEIAELRGVPLGKDVISPAFHKECHDPKSTVKFIAKIKEIAGVPVGMKLCLGDLREFRSLISEMKNQNVFPAYITIDGAEGGTGAAPKSFMDDLGVPLFEALPKVQEALIEAGVRDRMNLLASGKLISSGKQMMALSYGADACNTARGFMLALGCIQAVQCNTNTCPVGITTHDPLLQRGLNIEKKSERIKNYVDALMHDHLEIMGALGKRNYSELSESNLYIPLKKMRGKDV